VVTWRCKLWLVTAGGCVRLWCQKLAHSVQLERSFSIALDSSTALWVKKNCTLFRLSITLANIVRFLPRGMPSCGVCVCMFVCVSITFVDHVQTNKDIFEIFSPSGSHAILVFTYQTGWRYSDGTPPLTGASNAGGVGRNRDSEPIFGFSVCS